ncbi:MAG: NADH-quinone oxidoreductase subunit K 2 [Fimbriimonadales bacterium]
MEGIPLQHWLIAATLLFSMGLFGVIARRSTIALLMSIELMLAAANINFLAFWRYRWVSSIEAPVFVTIIILVAACEVAVGLGIILSMFRRFRSADVEDLKEMQG